MLKKLYCLSTLVQEHRGFSRSLIILSALPIIVSAFTMPTQINPQRKMPWFTLEHNVSDLLRYSANLVLLWKGLSRWIRVAAHTLSWFFRRYLLFMGMNTTPIRLTCSPIVKINLVSQVNIMAKKSLLANPPKARIGGLSFSL